MKLRKLSVLFLGLSFMVLYFGVQCITLYAADTGLGEDDMVEEATGEDMEEDTDEVEGGDEEDGDDSPIGGSAGVRPLKNFDEALEKFLGHKPSEAEKYDWSLAITSLLADGMNANGIAGVLGNVKAEGGVSSYYAIEGYSGIKTLEGKEFKDFEVGGVYDYGDVPPRLYTNDKGKTIGGEGHGICQWSFERATKLSQFAKDHAEYGYVTVTNLHKSYKDSGFSKDTFYIPSMGGQVCFMLEELHSTHKEARDKLLNASSAEGAALVFCKYYENPAGGSEDRISYAVASLALVESCTGLVGTPSGGGAGDIPESIAKDLGSMGYWDEDSLGSYSRLCEIDLDIESILRENLSNEEIRGLTTWEDNIGFQDTESIVLKFFRKLVVLFGILIILWSMLIYIAYWFDRLNNFIDIDLLSILTLGRLCTSDEEDSCTFHDSSPSKSGCKSVNHRVILFICVCGIGFGTMVISGFLYKVLATLVWKILRILG